MPKKLVTDPADALETLCLDAMLTDAHLIIDSAEKLKSQLGMDDKRALALYATTAAASKRNRKSKSPQDMDRDQLREELRKHAPAIEEMLRAAKHEDQDQDESGDD